MDQLQQLWDIEQIKNLKAKYFRYFDTGQYAEFLDLHTDDCVATRRGVVNGEPYESIQKIHDGGAADTFPEGVTVHHGHMPEIEIIDSTHARGIWAVMDYVVLPGYRNFVGYGHYHEEYRKCDDGRWRISARELTRLRVDELGPA